MVTYKLDYFNSPWNYFDCASIVITAILFFLHISRLSHQVRAAAAAAATAATAGTLTCNRWQAQTHQPDVAVLSNQRDEYPV
jgi:hypothetical protein